MAVFTFNENYENFKQTSQNSYSSYIYLADTNFNTRSNFSEKIKYYH